MIFEIKSSQNRILFETSFNFYFFCSDSYFYETCNKHVNIYINNYFSKKWIFFQKKNVANKTSIVSEIY